MIGVICTNNECQLVKEFFQLFKVAWKFADPNENYDIILSTRTEIPSLDAKVLLVYGSVKSEIDDLLGCQIEGRGQGEHIEWDGFTVPIYSDLATFTLNKAPTIEVLGGSKIYGFHLEHKGKRIARVGYNLFEEVAFLLSSGQPVSEALIPSLDLHISLLRKLVLESGVPFAEILPTPEGYDFTVCLTHDVDFAGIRRHKMDSTLLGFLYRALVGTLAATLRGKRKLCHLWANWKAVISLPLVYLGILRDFWQPFESYLKLEKDLQSTFFLVPIKNYAGISPTGEVEKRRAVAYDVSDVESDIFNLMSHGCEIGLHGLDTWRDKGSALAEKVKISKFTNHPNTGVRMHWLYFDDLSPAILDEAGFSYDSTWGYNDAIGYRAGTSQVFQFPDTKTLLELPLHIQDTALFYPSRMDLTEDEAFPLCQQLIQNASTFGGVLTFNWHGRSLSPERLWREFYRRLLAELRKFRVWFTTARQASEWFRARRSIEFEGWDAKESGNGPRLKVTASQEISPPATIRTYHSSTGGRTCGDRDKGEICWTDIEFTGESKEIQL